MIEVFFFVLVTFDERYDVNKVRMVCVDVTKFDFDEVPDHILGFVEGSREKFFHHIYYLL